jgi:predicted ATP-grasp superfamily ATP-dependent carboligase
VVKGLSRLLGVDIPTEDLEEKGESYRGDVVDPKMYG